MFDFHMHSRVSFDGHDTGAQLARAAADRGLKEICFTDHRDFLRKEREQTMLFDLEAYSREYDSLEVPGLTIRRGVEYGLYNDNQARMKQELGQRN